jgi:hypothetical protein
MDPITAIGLVTSIIQFVDVGSKIISMAKEIQESSSGLTKETEHLQESARRLQRLSIRMELSSTETLSPTQREVQCLAREGHEISGQMIKLLQSLSSTSANPLIMALRTLKQKPKLRVLEEKLRICCSQIQLQYSIVLG